MAKDNVSKQILRYEVDKASIASVERANTQLASGINRTGQDIRKAFSSGAQSSETLTTRIKEGEAQAKRLAERLNDVRKNAKAAADVNFDNLRAGTTGGAGGSAATGFDARDTAASRVSAISGAFDAGAPIANIAGLVADINAAGKSALDAGTSLQTLSIAGGASAIAVVGIALALQNFNQVTAEATANLTGALSAQEAYYQAVATLDEDAARERIAEMQSTLEAQRRNAETLRAAADSAYEQIAIEGTEIAASIAFAVNPALQELATNAAAAEAELASTEQTITRFQQGLENGDFAANNAAQSQEELARATELATQATLNAINQRVSDEVRYANLIETGSEERIQSLIEENELRLRILQEERANLAATATAEQDNSAAIAALDSQINTLTADTNRLSGEVLAAAEANDTERAAVEDKTRVLQDAARAEQERAQVIARTTAQITNIQQQQSEQARANALADSRAEIDLHRQRLRENIDFLREQAKAERDFLQRQADLIAEAQKAEGAAKSETLATEKEFNEKEAERVKKFEDTLADIRRKSQIEVGEAAGELDAKRVLAALQSRDEELKGAQEANTEEAAANAKAREERLAQIQEQLNEQKQQLQQRLQQERVAFQEEQQARTAAFIERRQRENEDLQLRRQREMEDRQARLAAQNAQINELKATLEQEKAARRSGLQSALADTANFFTQISAFARNARNNAASSGASSSGGGNKPPGSSLGGSDGRFSIPPSSTPPKKYRTGGNVGAGSFAFVGKNDDELAYFGRDARIVNNNDLRGIVGGGRGEMNPTINIYGATDPQAVGAQVRRELDKFWRSMP